MNNWRKILSWADPELQVGDIVRCIADKEMLRANAMDDRLSPYDTTYKIVSIHTRGTYGYPKAGKTGTISAQRMGYGSYYIFPYDNWRTYLEIVYD